jgi:hypothetical protein
MTPLRLEGLVLSAGFAPIPDIKALRSKRAFMKFFGETNEVAK